MDLQFLAERFCATPLPDSVCADPCASMQGYPNRTGTNLLTVVEAKQVLGHTMGTLLDGEAHHFDTIQGLRSALTEVYALAGEDPQLAKIINRALEAYPFP